jgi:mannosyl-oligosaccharide glucosidase
MVSILSLTNSVGHLLRVVHKGYVTLFPFMLGLIDPASPKLKAILNILSDKDKVWSPYGIRSLSKSDSYYGTGENYWRGPIWMNMNYLILSSLYKVCVPFPHDCSMHKPLAHSKRDANTCTQH